MLAHIEFLQLRRSILLVLMLVVAALAGCTANRGGYESLRSIQRFDCQSMPRSQYDACMQDANTPYTQYEKELEELQENQQSVR